MQPSILSLLPPLVVLALGIATHRVLFSLVCGIATASIIATDFSLIAAIKLFVVRLYETSGFGSLSSWEACIQSDTLMIITFLAMLGVITFLLDHCGGARAYARYMGKKLTTQKDAEGATMLLSVCLFIDDYFSTLTTGSIMKNLTDKLKIPRVKLAYLVDSMAASVAIIVPISSWVAASVGPLSKAGFSPNIAKAVHFSGDPFFVYLSTIPFIMYSLIGIASVGFIVFNRISFGSMHRHERIAATSGNLFGGRKQQAQAPDKADASVTPSLIDFIVPVLSFIFGIVFSILYIGSYHLLGGSNSFLQAILATNSAQALALGSTLSVLISTLFLMARQRLKHRDLWYISHKGFSLTVETMQILVLAWTMSELLSGDLQTGTYLAHLLTGSLPLVLLPLMLFITASVISFSMGSSWGALAIIIPLAMPLIASLSGMATPINPADFPFLYPALGAMLSGAVWGDHVSPISDTSIMSSASSGANHIDHISTQLLYTVPVYIGTGIALTVSGVLAAKGLLLSSAVGLGLGISLSWALLSFLNKGTPKEGSK